MKDKTCQIKTFAEIFELWKNQNPDDYQSYIKETGIKNESLLEEHPWYSKHVINMPVFKYRLPEGMFGIDYDWDLLIQMLEMSRYYYLNVKTEEIKLVNANLVIPELYITRWSIERQLIKFNDKEVTDIFVTLISDMVDMIMKLLTKTSDWVETKEINMFKFTYWNLLKTKIESKMAVSAIVSGNEEILKYVNGSN